MSKRNKKTDSHTDTFFLHSVVRKLIEDSVQSQQIGGTPTHRHYQKGIEYAGNVMAQAIKFGQTYASIRKEIESSLEIMYELKESGKNEKYENVLGNLVKSIVSDIFESIVEKNNFESFKEMVKLINSGK